MSNDIQNHQICTRWAGGSAGDQHALAIWGELQTIAPYRNRQSLRCFLGRNVNDGYRSVLSVGGPDFPAVWREVESFSASTRRDVCYPPSFPRGTTRRARSGRRTARRRCRTRRRAGTWSGDLFDDADSSGADVGSENTIERCGHDDHVCSVLPGAYQPIDTLRRWVVTADNLIRFRREIQLASSEDLSMRGMQRTEINGRQRLLSGEIDYRDGVESAVRTSVIGNVRIFAVRRGFHFMRIRSRRHATHDLQGRRIDNRQCIVAFLKNEQSQRRRLCIDAARCYEARCEEEAERFQAQNQERP